MSDKSYQIKENNQVMIQGGEKKVMKKILSVALSTAMAFSMFASVAFGDDALNTQQKFDVLKEKGIFTGYPDQTAGLDKDMTRAEFAKVLVGIMGLEPIEGKASFKDKNYKAGKWPAPYVEAVYSAGLMEGKNTTKMIFDFNGKITVEEMAKVLVLAQKLEVPTETNNNASNWAKGYVQAAINAGLVDAKANPKANASRSQLVEVAYTIYLSQQKPKVVSYEVTESGKVVTFKLANNEEVKVELETALKANTATEVKFKHNNYEYTESVTWVVTSATKVESASSTNLKEVEVAFDGKVDKATATDKNNYTIDANSKGIQSVTLLEDAKTVRILLSENSKFTQGTTYKVVVKNVKGESGSVLPQGEVSFTSSDNTLPTVSEVKGLGTAAIKVTFSEPVLAPVASNFQLDDKTFVGSVTQGADKREVILKSYTGAISAGTHKLTASLIEDYAGLKSLAQTTEFTAAVDTEGPKVTDITATLEKVTVTFDEEIDPASATNDSFYWKNGDSKKKGKVTQIASNVYEVQFDQANRLPGYESTLFIEVKDYSGNANAVKEHKITASVDLVQPRVLETSFGVDRANTLTVRFDKPVNGTDKANYTVKKDGNTIPVQNIWAADDSNRIFYVTFYQELEGSYDLKISGIKDRTALGNTLVEYSGTFVAADNASPTVKFADYNNSSRKITLNFGKAMDVSTLQERGHYYIGFLRNNATNVQDIALPAEVTVNSVNGGKSVVLTFPEYIDGTRVTFGENGTVRSVFATGLKSSTGQVVALDRTTLTAKNSEVKWTGAVRKDARTIELTFDQVIATARTTDFIVDGAYPADVSVSENKVTLKLNSDFGGGSVTLRQNNSIETYSNNKLNLAADTQMAVNNAVAPKLVSASDRTSSNQFVLTFSEPVAQLTGATEQQLREDFVLRNATKPSNSNLIRTLDYQIVDITGNKVTIEVKDAEANKSAITVQVREGAKYLVAAANQEKTAQASDPLTVQPYSQVASATRVTYTEFKQGAVAEAATASAVGIKLVQSVAGAEGNDAGYNVTIKVDDTIGAPVSINADKRTIKVKSDTTLNQIVSAINKDTAGAWYKAVLVNEEDGQLTPPFAAGTTQDVFTFTGGKDAESNTLVVNLNQDIDSVKDVVIRNANDGSNSVPYSATKGVKSFTVTGLGTRTVIGQELVATVKGLDGKDYILRYVIGENQK
ncbi:S-layer protein [Paenibacillus solani]|uniref:S-layer protein n=1 Tax=Paenibacillus solani TaxID=1705565 RepID=UPI003D2CAB30